MSSLRVLIPAEQIQTRVREMGAQIDRDLGGSLEKTGGGAPALCLVGVLKGSWMFLADLARAIQTPARIEFLRASSYGGGDTSSGTIVLRQDLDAPIEGQDVIVVEDILDTGVTAEFLLDLLWQRKPRSLRVAALLDKPERRQRTVRADYVGFVIPDQFVVGYGLDFAEKYRNLPDVCIVEPPVIP